eukprot:CAMPEP_0116575214 /NCGR_PEP_ID=MMETSP0397-20121206/19833_1 /TAXON_ID=216820 /ORGANISM="Cyclophora tenuis, Strain ECT3854" /LENGTH=147 /DNA_ID=CAMNT_0004104081 /DNA_START=28 /DNA_END=468 /DNA_ORIENTATION=+
MTITTMSSDSTTRMPLEDDERSMESMASDSSASSCAPQGECDSCPFCADTCDDPTCEACESKMKSNTKCHSLPFFGKNDEKFFTMCQVRRHCTRDSAWLLVGDTIYDATFYLSRHPGGDKSILRKAGGVCDCSVDFNFHSKHAKQMW